ncbi:MAG: hypothetical protein JRF33_01810 [Deltaproteobacteria bacterium]|nr:hypothetical protein [Deltaproteobacteria bacterium]
MTGDPMTPEEVGRLQQMLDEHSRSGELFITFACFFVVMTGVGFLLAPLSMGELVTAILFWPSAAGMFWMAWLGFRSVEESSAKEHDLKDDLTHKLKDVVEGPIQKKREAHAKHGAYYHFTVHDEEHEVDLTSYTRFDVGNHIRLSVSKKARAIVGVEQGQI